MRSFESVSKELHEAVVVDTSALPYGELNVSTLVALADDLDAVGVDLWIPEPVAWEFAAHAADRLTKIRKPVKDTANAFRNAGLKLPSLPYEDREQVINAVLERLRTLHARIEVIPCGGDAAREALRDQITLRGSGKRVGENQAHKSGGSDAAWIRTVHEKAGTSSNYVVMSSNTGDVKSMFELLGRRPVPTIVPNEDALRRLMFSYEKAPYEAAREAARLLGVWQEIGQLDDYAGLHSLSLGPRLISYFEDWSPLDYSVEVSRVVGLAGVEDVEVAPETGTATLVATFIGDLDVTGWFHDDVNDELVSDTRHFYDVTMSVPLVLQGAQGELVTGHATEEPDVRPAVQRWSDEEDALADCTALSGVPDVVYGRGSEAFHQELVEDGASSFKTRSDVSISAELDRDTGEEWTLRVLAEADTLLLKCRYDDTSWVGGSREGMHIEPPWTVTVQGDGDVELNAAWALDEFLMRRSM